MLIGAKEPLAGGGAFFFLGGCLEILLRGAAEIFFGGRSFCLVILGREGDQLLGGGSFRVVGDIFRGVLGAWARSFQKKGGE